MLHLQWSPLELQHTKLNLLANCKEVEVVCVTVIKCLQEGGHLFEEAKSGYSGKNRKSRSLYFITKVSGELYFFVPYWKAERQHGSVYE